MVFYRQFVETWHIILSAMKKWQIYCMCFEIRKFKSCENSVGSNPTSSDAWDDLTPQ